MSQTQHPSHREWANVDESADPQAYVRFLDASREKVLARISKDPKAFFAYLGVKPGTSILEVGSGTGSTLHPLAELVQPGGRVIGIDYSGVMVEEARRRAGGTGLPLEFHQMDAGQLQFPDNSFDRSSSNIVFQHLPDPNRALAEMIRVTKPGGLVVINENDWDTIVIDSDDKSATRSIVQLFSDSIANGWIGRQLYGMFIRAGLKEVTVTPNTLTFGSEDLPLLWHLFEPLAGYAVAKGDITQGQKDAWLKEQDQKAKNGQFFAAFTVFRVSGTKK